MAGVLRIMRKLPGIVPGNLPVLAALAAAAGFTLLLAATAIVYVTVDWLGALIVAGFLLASLGLAASGWIAHWRALEAAVAAPAPAPAAGQDSPAHRLLEAVASEVRASAGTITGFSELLGSAPEGLQAEARQHILADSRRLLGFASDLHDFVRFERGRLRLKEQQVDAAELIEQALATCRGEAERTGTVIVGDLLEGVEIACDAERIGRAVSSLVLWAVGAAADGAVIDVRLLRLPEDGLAIDVACRGMASAAGAAAAERLFEPQLTQTGLRGFALPIASRVALLHAGEVTAAVNPEAGPAARLTLPAARVTWPAAEQQRPARAA